MTKPVAARGTGILQYRFWTPPAGMTVAVGPEERPVPLPEIPLPVHREVLLEGPPDGNAIGQGVYDYLRQFPDCPRNQAYAELLRDAYPHYLADLGSQVVMLDHKEVDPPYVKRKINYLKILALLDPQQAGLQQQIGGAWLQLALTFTEMGDARHHLQQALKHLGRALELEPGNSASLNLLAQVDYFLGDFPAARRRWQQVLEQVADPAQRAGIEQRLARLAAPEPPDHPLVDEFEAIGGALELCGRGDFEEACLLVDRIEEQGQFPREMPAAEFFYLAGLCRERTGEAGGAFAAYQRALELDPGYGPARDAMDGLLAKGTRDDA